MNCVELFPSLDHCIESTAREEFWNSVNGYPEGGRGDKDLEERIEILKCFLEVTDFRKLRSQSEKHLIEGRKVRFVICRLEGRLDCQIMVSEGS